MQKGQFQVARPLLVCENESSNETIHTNWPFAVSEVAIDNFLVPPSVRKRIHLRNFSNETEFDLLKMFVQVQYIFGF